MNIPTQAEIRAAADRLSPYLGWPTPLFHFAALSELLGADIWLKVETTGPIASFKLRGALCRVPVHMALATLLASVGDAFLVPEASLLPAMQTAAMAGRILVEPGAAAGLAGAWHRRAAIKDKRVVILLTGANASAALLQQSMLGPDLPSL